MEEEDERKRIGKTIDALPTNIEVDEREEK